MSERERERERERGYETDEKRAKPNVTRVKGFCFLL